MAVLTDLDLLYAGHYPNAIVTLFHPILGTYSAPISSDLSLSGSSEYTNPLEGIGEEVRNKIRDAKMLFNSLGLDDKNWLNSDKLLMQTAHRWANSSTPDLSLNLQFINTSSTTNRTAKAIELASCVYPELISSKGASSQVVSYRSGGGGNKGTGSTGSVYKTKLEKEKTSLLRAPGNTSIDPDGGMQNGWIVSIGTYACVPGLMLTSAEITMSQQRMSNGSALYANVAVTFKPGFAISRQEFRSWFS